MSRQRDGLSTRSLAEAWWAPLIDAERHKTWAACRERIHAAIQRARLRGGYESAETSALGEHLYATDGQTRRRSA